MGDDAARALGIAVEPTALVLIVLGVPLIATVTALAGPIAFVALAAPQIVRATDPGARGAAPSRGRRGRGPAGGLRLVAPSVFAPVILPVGLVTVDLRRRLPGLAAGPATAEGEYA